MQPIRPQTLLFPSRLESWPFCPVGRQPLAPPGQAATASSFHQAGFPATVSPAGCANAGCPPRPFQATLDEAGRLDTVAGEPQPSSRAAAGARRWRCGPYRRSRRSRCEPGWCGPGRPTRDGAAVAGVAPQPPTARRGQAPPRERSWRGILPSHPQGRKRRLSVLSAARGAGRADHGDTRS